MAEVLEPLEAVIPHGGRPSLARTVASLLATGLVGAVLVVTCDDPGDDPRDAHGPGAALADPRVRLLRVPPPFDKARFLNAGLRQAAGTRILLSDADILWSADGLAALVAPVAAGRADLACVAAVAESEPARTPGEPSGHRRYRARVARGADGAVLTIEADPADGPERPGYGLVHARRASLLALGGFMEGWGGGWGWEDVDLIVRAELLGLRCVRAGRALHLSHGDGLRALRGATKAQARDHNLRLSLAAIAAGRLHGPLAPAAAQAAGIRIRLEAPADLLPAAILPAAIPGAEPGGP